jgi:hypothetical protein
MIARAFGLAMLGLAVAAFSVGTAGDKDKEVKKDVGKDVVKDKDAGKDKIEKKDKKDKDKKDAPKLDLKSVAGEVTAIDFQKGAFSLGAADGKARTFMVNDDTKFVGPKGGSRGLGVPGLKDETLVKGAAVRVVFAQDGKVALEIHLPTRGTTAPKIAPEPIKQPAATPPAATPPAVTPPAATPPAATPPLAAQPQVVPLLDPGMERVGPVRRLLRRVFGGYRE